jgi:hypothetical protein
LNSCPEEGA